MITGTDIAAIYGDSTLSGMFSSAFISAIQKEKIETVIGETALIYIVDNETAETPDESIVSQYNNLKSSLAYYCAAEGLSLIATRAENRGVFELTAEMARSASPGAIKSNQLVYNTIANSYLKMVVEWLESGDIEGMEANFGSERFNPVYAENDKRGNLI